MSDKFTLFTIHNPNPAKNNFGVALPGKGCAIGVEFENAGQQRWCGLFIRDGMTPDKVANGLEALAKAVRNKEWSAVGAQWRAGQEITPSLHGGYWVDPEKNTGSIEPEFVTASGFELAEKYASEKFASA